MGVVFATLVGILAFLAGILIIGWALTTTFKFPASPYTGLPLQAAYSLPLPTKQKIYAYLKDQGGFDNQPFRFAKAAFDRETGRIFQDCVDWKGKMEVDWTFLLKRYNGQWVSWGSLSEELKRKVKERHSSMEGFQTERSSPEPSPTKIEPLYAYTKPGPLYVDLQSMILMGWKLVPDTSVEVLIVQQPDR